MFIGVAFELDLEEWLEFWWLSMEENVFSEEEIVIRALRKENMFEGSSLVC